MLESAALIAVTTILVAAVTAGALYRPEELMLPPLADQETAWFVVLLTAAVNCCVPLDARVALCGDTATTTGTERVKV